MAWPLGKKDETVVEQPKPEKTIAEQIAEAFTPMKAQLDTLGNELKDLKDKTVRKPEPPKEPVRQEAPVSVLDNEEVAFAQRMTPMVLQQLDTRFEVMYDRVKAEYDSDVWKQFEQAIRENLEGAPHLTGDGKPLRSDPQYIRNVADMVIGRAARTQGFKFDGSKKKFFLEDANGEPNGNPTPRPEDGLSETQMKAIRKWGMTPEEYKKAQAQLEVIK